MRRITHSAKAQGATEYLVLIGVALLIATFVIGILVWPTGSTKDVKKSNTDIQFKIAAMEYPDLLQGLVAYYKFDEGSGATAGDSRGGVTGNLTNGPAWVAGKSGYALDFDGVNDNVRIDSGQHASCTLSAWIKPYGLTGSYRNIITGSPANILSYILLATGDNTLRVYNGSVYINGMNMDYVWNHIAITFEGGTGDFIIYQNGSQTNTGHSIYTNCRALAVGINSDYTGRPFNGSIDEVMIFNRALSAGEIRLLYENPGYPQ